MEIEISTPVIGAELGGSIVQDDYERLKNLPSINGKELIGDLTTEDLGIEAGGNFNILSEYDGEEHQENDIYNANAVSQVVNLMALSLPDILTEFDIENEYEDKQVYNANAIHQLLEIFVMEMENMQNNIDDMEERVASLETLATELEEI